MSSSRATLRRVPPDVSDAELLARIASGELDALGALYDRHAVALHRFAQRAAGPDEADDVVHEVFLRIVRIAVGFDAARGSGRAWLFGIATCVLRERRRSFHRLSVALREFAAAIRTAVAPSGALGLDADRGLSKLSDAKRIVFLLAEIEGFSGLEIAEMLGVPVGTVWTRLHHARRELRDSLGGDEP